MNDNQTNQSNPSRSDKMLDTTRDTTRDKASWQPTDVSDWWRTSIIDMQPGEIRFRGYPIEQLIGHVSFVDMIYLMTRGELPDKETATLLEAALVSSVDHGPQAPSIAIARMTMSCGGDLNNAIGSAVNVLDSIHGGAGQEAMTLYMTIAKTMEDDSTISLDAAVTAGIDSYLESTNRIPGFGHRYHPIDPRTPRLLKLVKTAVEKQAISGRYCDIALAIEASLEKRKGKRIPMNIDGITAVIYAELGFSPALARGLFCLSRSVGILSHAWEQSQEAHRIKGPTPPQYRWTYDGPPIRDVPEVNINANVNANENDEFKHKQ